MKQYSGLRLLGLLGLIGLILSGLLSFYSISLAEEGKWTKKAEMPTPRTAFSTSVVSGKIYAIGGLKIVGRVDPALSTTAEYDPLMDKWMQKADMPTARHGLSTSVMNGKIYAIGGPKKADVSKYVVEEYDPQTDIWTRKGNMPTIREVPTSVVNGKIYVIGGWKRGNVLSTVEEYDPETGTWTKKAEMLTARGSLSTSAVGGKIYAIGGTGLGGVLATVEEYDLGFAGEGVGVKAKGKLPTSWGKIKSNHEILKRHERREKRQN